MEVSSTDPLDGTGAANPSAVETEQIPALAFDDVELPDMVVQQDVPIDWDEKQVNSYLDTVDWGVVASDMEIEQDSVVKQEVEGVITMGLRQNNPGNIRRGQEQWGGMSSQQPNNGFIAFESPVMGIRAMTKVLQTYKNKHGIDSIAGVVSRWAPPSENDTARYAKVVSARMGLEPSSNIDLSDPEALRPLMKAMIFMENSTMPYEDATLDEGMRLGGLKVQAPDQQTAASSGFSLISSAQAAEVQPSEPDTEGSMLAGIIPANVRAITSDVLGIDEGQVRDEDYFSSTELKTIKSLVNNNMKRTGSTEGNVEYTKDYTDKLDGVYISQDVDFDNNFSGGGLIKTTLGQFAYHTDKDGNTIVTDKYDFNDAAVLQKKYPTLQDKLEHLWKYSKEKSVGTYGLARRFGGLFGSTTAEDEGSRFKLNLGKL